MNAPVPHIRLELDSLKISFHHAFTQMQISTDTMVRQALEEVCKPERLQEIITRQAKEAIDAAVREEVTNFFRFGGGRKVVKAAVEKALSEKEGV